MIGENAALNGRYSAVSVHNADLGPVVQSHLGKDFHSLSQKARRLTRQALRFLLIASKVLGGSIVRRVRLLVLPFVSTLYQPPPSGVNSLTFAELFRETEDTSG